MTGQGSSVDPEEIIKKFEPLGHVAQGFAAGLLNSHWWTWRREKRQYPPRTDKLPELWIDSWGNVHSTLAQDSDLYFAAERVDDVYKDFMDYHVGYVLAGVFKDSIWVCLAIWLVVR